MNTVPLICSLMLSAQRVPAAAMSTLQSIVGGVVSRDLVIRALNDAPRFQQMVLDAAKQSGLSWINFLCFVILDVDNIHVYIFYMFFLSGIYNFFVTFRPVDNFVWQRRNLFSLNHHNAGVIVLSMIIVIYIARGKGAPLLAGDAARPMRSSGRARHVWHHAEWRHYRRRLVRRSGVSRSRKGF